MLALLSDVLTYLAALLAMAIAAFAAHLSLIWMTRFGALARWCRRFVVSYVAVMAFGAVFIVVGKDRELSKRGDPTTYADMLWVAAAVATVWATAWPFVATRAAQAPN